MYEHICRLGNLILKAGQILPVAHGNTDTAADTIDAGLFQEVIAYLRIGRMNGKHCIGCYVDRRFRNAHAFELPFRILITDADHLDALQHLAHSCPRLGLPHRANTLGIQHDRYVKKEGIRIIRR